LHSCVTCALVHGLLSVSGHWRWSRILVRKNWILG